MEKFLGQASDLLKYELNSWSEMKIENENIILVQATAMYGLYVSEKQSQYTRKRKNYFVREYDDVLTK